MKITVIGGGYVGLVTGACFAEFGNFVICMDNDAGKIKMLKRGKAPFFEPGLNELIERNMQAGRLSFTLDASSAIESASVIFIAVGTPPNGDGSADLSMVEAVAKEIGRNLNNYKVIVTKSTVPVGTGAKIQEIIGIQQALGDRENNFDVVSNPEFLREGSAIEDAMRPNRVVIGASSERAFKIMKDLYKPLYIIEVPMVLTDVKTAELIKYASNAFLAVKISFINEIANLCEAVGADVQVVSKAMGLDRRIGPKFLHAGPGYGGSCFPKDTKALGKIGSDHGVEMTIVRAADNANAAQKKRTAEKIIKAVKKNKGQNICVLGLAFKPNTNDIREAPALDLIGEFLQAQLTVLVYDPVAKYSENMKKMVMDVSNPYDAAKNADAVVIVTEWNEFRNLDLERLKKVMKGELFFDLRNVYDPAKVRELGFTYFSTGRP